MKVEINPDDVDTYPTDSRGRINLGSALGNKEVEVAVLEIKEKDDE